MESNKQLRQLSQLNEQDLLNIHTLAVRGLVQTKNDLGPVAVSRAYIDALTEYVQGRLNHEIVLIALNTVDGKDTP